MVAGPGSDDNDGDIGSVGGRDSLVKTGLVARPALAALGEGGGWDVLVGVEFGNVVEKLTSCAGGFDAVVWADSSEVAAVYNVVAVLPGY